MSKKKEEYITALQEHVKSAESRMKYSLERFDILIISLSSGGLALSLSLYQNFKNSNKDYLTYAWIFFSSALIINLLSQITGYLANKYDIDCTKIIIDKEKRKNNQGNNKKLDNIINVCNYATNSLNLLSFLSLSTAIIILTIFINSNNVTNMSDDSKKGNSSNSKQPETKKQSAQESHKVRLNETSKEDWSKIDKKGMGATGRPKK